MRTIQSTNNHTIQVSDEDYDRVNQYRWYARYDKRTSKYYLIHNVWKNNKITHTLMLGRFVLEIPYYDRRFVADHLDRNPLNNTRENLRIATWRENATNKKNKSKYGTGVQYQERLGNNPYRAFAQVGGIDYHIGTFATETDAQNARVIWLLDRGIEVREV